MESTSTRSAPSDVPALAETDLELWTDFLGDYISVWLRNSSQFIDKQRQKMYKLALCPFLFGVSRSVPQTWLEVLHTYGVIEMDRENNISPLSEQEMETLDMAETIFMRCSQLVSNKNDLKTILNFIYEVEERSALLGRIDMAYALQEVVSLEVFASMWAPIKRYYEKRKKQAHVCIIYYFKIISYHVTQYGQNGTDRVTFLESMLCDLFRHDKLESVTKEDADRSFYDGNYSLAVEQYSALLEKDPLNCYFYLQRSQAYTKLCDYWAALSDCRRSIVLEPENYFGYFKAAELYLELGQLEKAEDLNQQTLECCLKYDQLGYTLEGDERERFEELTQKIGEKRRMTKLRETSTSSESDEREPNYTKLIHEGSALYLSGMYSRAADLFKAALDVVARSKSEDLVVEGDDLAFIWLLYGLSCVKTEHTRNVQSGIDKFNAIIARTETFPAAFYGLALAYVALKRYQEAGIFLETGLARLQKCGDVKIFYWPGTDTAVEETVQPSLKKLMEDLLKETMFPPKPDAVCKFHIDTDNLKKEMYFSDPDYKGHVCIKCNANCSITFHPQCWKPNDSHSRGKNNWKEILDTQCPTPACWGMITDVFICRPDPEKNLKISSQMENRPNYRPPRPKLKLKTESLIKLEKKIERKRLRKEKRQEARQKLQEEQANQELLENVTSRIILPPEDEVVNLNIDRTGTVLRKDDPEMVVEKKAKASKNKKKEKKQKQFLAVDVQFKGDENKERYGINSLDDDGDVVSLLPAAGLLPTPGSEPSTATSKSLPLQQPALEIALYEFFYTLLITKGPLDLQSKELDDQTKHLSEEAQAYILSYGGLGRFLAAHRQFQVSPNKVVSAIPISLLGTPHLKPQMNPLKNPHLLPQLNPGLVPQANPWQNRPHKPADAQSARSSQGQWLNPSAEEFVPQDAAAAQGLTKTLQRDQWELADGSTGGGKSDSSEELPPPAVDEDDVGFTTVVNKKKGGIQKLPSFAHPGVPSSAFLKPGSSFSSLDEIHLDVDPTQKVPQASVVALEGDQNKGDGDNKHPDISHGKMDSLDSFWDYPLDKEPNVRKVATERKTEVISPVVNKSGPGSNVSDISADDLHHRVSSPALSSNSGGSSGRAEGSGTGSQTSGQLTSLRPLKAPSIVLPTRGKNKRPLGSKLYANQRLPSGDSSHVSDGCEMESVSSTASDRVSTCGDVRAPSTDQLQMPPVAESSLRERTSETSEPTNLSTASGQDVFSTPAHDIPPQDQFKSKKFQAFMPSGSGKTSVSDGIVTSDPGFDDEIHGWKKTWPDSLASEKLPRNSLLSDLKPFGKYDKAGERRENSTEEIFGNLLSQPCGDETPTVDCGVSEELAAGNNRNSQPDATWPSWSWELPGSYRKTSGDSGDDIRVPPSDPWQNKDKATAHFYTDVYRESPELPTLSVNTDILKVGPFSRELGLIGSSKLDTDPWSSRSDSPTTLSANITFHNDRSFSPFAAWMNVSTEPRIQSSTTELPFASGTSTEPSVYTSISSTKPSVFTSSMSTKSSVYSSAAPAESSTHKSAPSSTESSVYKSSASSVYKSAASSVYKSTAPSVSKTDSSTKLSGATNNPLSSTMDNSSKPHLHASLTRNSKTRTEMEPSASPSFAAEGILSQPAHLRAADERVADRWGLGQSDRGSLDHRVTQGRSVDIQTSLTGTQIDEMLVSSNMLKDSRAQLASVLHEKLELQEQLSQESSVRDQLKQENSRLLTKIQIAETSSEEWKDECSQLIKTIQQLSSQVRSQAETIDQLNKQLDQSRTTSVNAQMDALTMKKDLAVSKIDMKQLEALHHFQRLSNVIAQAKISDKHLPESVYEKHAEFSEYMSTCEMLSKHIQVIYQRLTGDLQRGLPVDMAQLEVSLPLFPKSPTEPSDRPQTSSSSLPNVDHGHRVQSPSPHRAASIHSSPSRGRSSIHSSPSRDCSSIDSSPSHSRGMPPLHGISSIHSSPSRSVPARAASPAHSSGSSHSSLQPDRTPILTSVLRDQQKKAGSALEPDVQPPGTEDEDADAYLKMIYGGSSSKDSLNKAKVSTAASVSQPRGLGHQQKDTFGRLERNPTTSRLLSSATHAPHLSQGVPSSKILAGHRQSHVPMEAAMTASVRPQLRQHSSHAGPQQSQQQLPYFERIVQTVQEQLPECSREKIQKIVDTLRRNNGGTLSGWTFERLANEILDMILDLEQGQDLATFEEGCRADEHLATSIWDYDLTCSICQSQVAPREALTLSCGHKFHEACVQKWLTNDRSCPNCRSHALLPEDFPILK